MLQALHQDQGIDKAFQAHKIGTLRGKYCARARRYCATDVENRLRRNTAAPTWVTTMPSASAPAPVIQFVCTDERIPSRTTASTQPRGLASGSELRCSAARPPLPLAIRGSHAADGRVRFWRLPLVGRDRRRPLLREPSALLFHALRALRAPKRPSDKSRQSSC